MTREKKPVRYELIDKDGHSITTSVSVASLASLAGCLWPDQTQDEERSGKGWDIQVVGCDRSVLAIETRDDGIS